MKLTKLILLTCCVWAFCCGVGTSAENDDLYGEDLSVILSSCDSARGEDGISYRSTLTNIINRIDRIEAFILGDSWSTVTNDSIRDDGRYLVLYDDYSQLKRLQQTTNVVPWIQAINEIMTDDSFHETCQNRPTHGVRGYVADNLVFEASFDWVCHYCFVRYSDGFDRRYCGERMNVLINELHADQFLKPPPFYE
jgi:hypothetical protein